MKKILVINCGSSSLKFELFVGGKEPTSIAEGLIDGIGKDNCRVTFKSSELNLGLRSNFANHTAAIKYAFDALLKSKSISKLSDISIVGHRVVHGGEKYQKATKIDAKVLKEIKALCPLAPLHNPINLKGIEACKKLLPRAKQIAVFDTAFHQTLNEKTYLYAIPQEFYTKHRIRKYGFPGTSHKYVTNETIKLLGKKPNPKIITCHFGNGSSITASKSGKVVDTSLGYTPLDGIPMGTRSGSLDPTIPLRLQQLKKWTPAKTDEFLNRECGLKGLSGISSDMREIYAESLKKNPDALLTIGHLAYHSAKYIGSYIAALDGLDALVFTAGMGEKAFYVREQICEHFSHLGLKLDKNKNKKNDKLISTKSSKVKVFVIPTDEEYQIAKESLQIK
ncbi:acetate kinase [Candidatus Peregrinibacteria bacterium]|nr:acetate kinase [Candidatus Peregrinibacteria bacterium]